MPLQVARVSSACETGEGQPVSHVQFTSKKLAEKSSEHPFCQVKTPPELRIPSLFWSLGEWNKRVGPVELNAIELTKSLGPEATKEATPFIFLKSVCRVEKQRRLRAPLVQIAC